MPVFIVIELVGGPNDGQQLRCVTPPPTVHVVPDHQLGHLVAVHVLDGKPPRLTHGARSHVYRRRGATHLYDYHQEPRDAG